MTIFKGLTFGMETTLFRFGGKNEEDGSMVYSTSYPGGGANTFLTFFVLGPGYSNPNSFARKMSSADVDASNFTNSFLRYHLTVSGLR